MLLVTFIELRDWRRELNEHAFERDIRSTEPNEIGYRRARFREGWRKATIGERYSEATLKELTWDNLGYRVGALFGETSPLLVDELYLWCVRQQSERARK